jgi:hypothetical protein
MKKKKPWRYKLVETKLSFWQSLRIFLRDWHWRTIRQDFVVVNPNDPEWESAPFETAVIYARAFGVKFPEAQVVYKR